MLPKGVLVRNMIEGRRVGYRKLTPDEIILVMARGSKIQLERTDLELDHEHEMISERLALALAWFI